MAQSAKKYIRRCVVSRCQNNSQNFPDKIFFAMPIKGERRLSWLLAMGKKIHEFPKGHSLFVCEDHFDVETDMQDFMRWKIMGGRNILKQDVVPHKLLEMDDTICPDPKKPRLDLETEKQTSMKGKHRKVANILKPKVVPHLFECQDNAANDGAVASTSRDISNYNNLSSSEVDDSYLDVPDLLPERQPTPLDASIVKIEIENEPLKIKNEPSITQNNLLTSDTHGESTLPFIKAEPLEESDRLASETVDQLDESERQSIQWFFDGMAKTVMTLPLSFVSRIKAEVLRLVIDIEMEANLKKMGQLTKPSRKIDKIAASNETEPRIKIENEDDGEAEASDEPDQPDLVDPELILDLDHDANYEPSAKKKTKSKTEAPIPSLSPLEVNRTARTLHEPVESFFQSVACTVKSFPPPFVCKAKVAVHKVISKMEVEVCRSHQSGYRDGGGGGDKTVKR
ncbi:unnamed protein product [Ceutorhynchus assimilis]|uniref:THAP-type domain-containing protein n=1 Tax=Ceutorhynchus assimilis TaxID=467358 RepID=A0A9P0GMF6_9CUCU|nr:unnamed protein product [Ceutorhynchus assimilis]